NLDLLDRNSPAKGDQKPPGCRARRARQRRLVFEIKLPKMHSRFVPWRREVQRYRALLLGIVEHSGKRIVTSQKSERHVRWIGITQQSEISLRENESQSPEFDLCSGCHLTNSHTRG